MNSRRFNIIHIYLCSILILLSSAVKANEDELHNKKVYISKSRGSTYELLQQVSEQIGYFFIYDSQLVSNSRAARIEKGEYYLLDAVRKIVGNPRIEVRLIDSHMLIYLPSQEVKQQSILETKIVDKKRCLSLKGRVRDRYSNEPLPYVSVSLKGTAISTVTNQEGRFELIVQDSLRHAAIKIVYLGYQSQEAKAEALAGRQVDFLLEPQHTSLQEVVVRSVNPMQLLQKVVDNRSVNYSTSPVYMITFYREMVEYKKSMNFTEGVLGLYKAEYREATANDQVKLLKMRRVINQHVQDTILVKVKAGIEACLLLDVVKKLPNFFTLNSNDNPYSFLHTDITTVDGEDVHVVSFEQIEGVEEPLHKGKVYISTSSYALLRIDFEVNPKYVEAATPAYVVRPVKNYRMVLQKAHYTISYKPDSTGDYHINHTRGDLAFKVKKKKSIFSTPLNVSFEMVVCDIQEGEKPIFRSERLPSHKIFSDVKHSYDADFWGRFNTIVPEDRLKDLIVNNLNEVSELSKHKE